jgi:glycosyltransferase involved in cell wall biosynthesis
MVCSIIMHILMINASYKPAYVYGGPIQSMALLCEGLLHAGAQVTVLTTNAGGHQPLDVPLHTPVRVDGVPVTYFPAWYNPLESSFYYTPALTEAALRLAPTADIIIVNTVFNHAAYAAYTAATRTQTPYVVVPRGQLMPWSLHTKSLKKQLYLWLFGERFLKRAAAIHCTDAAEASSLPYLLPHFVVPNAIRLEAVQVTDRQVFRSQHGIPAESFLLIQSGRLHPKKRPQIALDVLAALPPDAHLVFAGVDETGMTQSLLHQAQALGVRQRVHFTGLLEQTTLHDALRSADLLIMPSEPASENFGMAALEALACGTPILTTDSIPVGRMAQAHGGAVAAADARSFIQMAQQLGADRAQLRERGAEGQRWVRETFDYRAVARQVLTEYEHIVQQGKPR